MTRASRRSEWPTWLGICGALAFLVTPFGNSAAQNWDLEAMVEVSLIHTDNVRVAEEGAEESDLIARIAPTFTLSKAGDRFEADIQYRPEALFYGETEDTDSVYHSLDANMTSTLVPGALYLFASALNSQSIVSPLVNIPTSTIPISANRVDSRVLEVRPYWDQDLGIAQILLEAGYQVSRYDNIDEFVGAFLQDNDRLEGRFTLDNLDRGEGFAWGLNYWFRRVEYTDALPWEYQQASLSLGYWLNQNLRIFVLTGFETPYFNILDSSLEDEFWESGIQYVVGQRLDLELAVGDRSFGETYRARLNYEFRRGETSLTYVEEPSTRAEDAFNRPLTLPDNLDTLLNQPFASDRFLRRRGEWSIEIDLAKSATTLRIFTEDRDRRSTDTGLALEDEQFAGVAFRWQWSFGDNTSLGLITDITRRETEDFEDEIRRYAIDYTHYLTPRYGLVLLAQHSRQFDSTADTDRYSENQVWLTLRAEF